MTTVADILEYLNALAPQNMKEDWDRVGLNCGRLNAEVTRILVALDPFTEVCREAKDFGAQLLVTHHALLWKPGFVTDADTQGTNALFLMENGIAHINAHTNLDVAPAVSPMCVPEYWVCLRCGSSIPKEPTRRDGRGGCCAGAPYLSSPFPLSFALLRSVCTAMVCGTWTAESPSIMLPWAAAPAALRWRRPLPPDVTPLSHPI